MNKKCSPDNIAFLSCSFLSLQCKSILCWSPDLWPPCLDCCTLCQWVRYFISQLPRLTMTFANILQGSPEQVANPTGRIWLGRKVACDQPRQQQQLCPSIIGGEQHSQQHIQCGEDNCAPAVRATISPARHRYRSIESTGWILPRHPAHLPAPSVPAVTGRSNSFRRRSDKWRKNL